MAVDVVRADGSYIVGMCVHLCIYAASTIVDGVPITRFIFVVRRDAFAISPHV